jgi:predicted membrane GTPase involved in stress response
MQPMFDLIMKQVPPAEDFSDKPLRLQIANLSYDDYLGRL